MIRTCPHCGAKNRVPARYLHREGKCGSCKSPLPPAGEPIETDPDLFREIVSQAPVPILVDFWADWCGPCKMAAPHVEAVAKDVAGKALVLKVDTERYPDLAAEFRVQALPNFVLLSGGNVVLHRAGVAPKDQMRRWIEMAGQPAAR